MYKFERIQELITFEQDSTIVLQCLNRVLSVCRCRCLAMVERVRVSLIFVNVWVCLFVFVFVFCLSVFVLVYACVLMCVWVCVCFHVFMYQTNTKMFKCLYVSRITMWLCLKVYACLWKRDDCMCIIREHICENYLHQYESVFWAWNLDFHIHIIGKDVIEVYVTIDTL